MLAKNPLKEKSLSSSQKQQGSQTTIQTWADLSSALAQEASPNNLLCPPRKEEWGKQINHCKRAADVQRKKGREPEVIPEARLTGLTNET